MGNHIKVMYPVHFHTQFLIGFVNQASLYSKAYRVTPEALPRVQLRLKYEASILQIPHILCGGSSASSDITLLTYSQGHGTHPHAMQWGTQYTPTRHAVIKGHSTPTHIGTQYTHPHTIQ